MLEDPNFGAAVLNPPEISNFETKLLSALRQHPNRLLQWISQGNPMQRHQLLLSMYCKLYDIAMRHNLEYFLEYGSLLGYVRHRGMIPWEYDMDIACDLENFQRWKEVGQWYEDNDETWGFKYYSDPDYDVEGYCMYLKADPIVLCDINEYREVEENGVVYLECTQPDWNYPRYRKDFIYPLQAINTLGYRGYIPRLGLNVLEDVEKILGQCTHGPNGIQFTDDFEQNGVIINNVKWQEYDPVPFLLCKLYNPDHIEKLVTWPVLDVPEADTILEGFATYGKNNMPFIVRGPPGITFDLDEMKKKAEEQAFTTFGWTRPEMLYVPDLSVTEAINQWEDGNLTYSFLDSPIPNLVEPNRIIPELADIGITPESLMLILSNHDNYSPFHQDSPAGENGGGGWMYLGQGKKMWQMVKFEDTDHIFDPEKKKFNDLPMHELLYLNNHALWGKMWQGYIEDGDFLYFPPATTHRVTTYAKSIGYGGYINHPSQNEKIEEIKEWYQAHGCNLKQGIMFRELTKDENDA